MPKGKRVSAEEIVSKLRLAEVDLAKGNSIEDVCKKIQTQLADPGYNLSNLSSVVHHFTFR